MLSLSKKCMTAILVVTLLAFTGVSVALACDALVIIICMGKAGHCAVADQNHG